MTDPRWSRSVPFNHDILGSIIDQSPAYPQDLEIRQDSQTPYTLSPNIDPALEFDIPTSQYNVGSPPGFDARQPSPTFEFSAPTSPVATGPFRQSATVNTSYNAEYPPLPGSATPATSLLYGFRPPLPQAQSASMAHSINYWSHQDQCARAPLSYAQAIATTQRPPAPLQQRAQTFRLEQYINAECFEDSPQLSSLPLASAPTTTVTGGQSTAIPVYQQRSLDTAVRSMQLQIAGAASSSNMPASPSVRSTGSRRSTLTQRSRRSSRAGRSKAEHKCHHCNKILPSKVKLEHHSRSHDQRYRFSCRLCDIYFEKEADLNHHDKNVHSKDDSKIHRCPECGLGFLWKPYLTRHMVKHTGAKPFKCLICVDNRQTRYDNLRRHYRTAHNGQIIPTIEQCRIEPAVSETNSNATGSASSVDLTPMVYHQPGAMHLAVSH